MPPIVRISDLGLYLRCPRLVYFDALGRLPWKASPRNHLLRELMLSSSEDVSREALASRLKSLKEELPLIEEVDEDELECAALDLEERLAEISSYMESFRPALQPSEVDLDLRSDRLGLSGRLDRLVQRDDGIPSIIRSGSAPSDGIWKRDRLQLAGYALLLEAREAERTGENVRRIGRGLVEYPLAGELREVSIRPIDRARMLRLRDRIRDIKDGRLPDRPKDAPCESCQLEEPCRARWSLASKFF